MAETHFEGAIPALTSGVETSQAARTEADRVEEALDNYETDYPEVDLTSFKAALAYYKAGLKMAEEWGGTLGYVMSLVDRPILGDVELALLDLSPTLYDMTIDSGTAGRKVTLTALNLKLVPYSPSVSSAQEASGFIYYGQELRQLNGKTFDYGDTLSIGLDIVTTKTITGVTWKLDGATVRDNDLDAPYTLLANSANITIGSDFTGQGSALGTVFNVDEGSHTFQAEVAFSDASTYTATATITVTAAPVIPVGEGFTVLSSNGLENIYVKVPKGFAGPSNTGHTKSLTSTVTSYATLTPGLYEQIDFRNGVIIPSVGVTMRNCRVYAPPGTGGGFVVKITHGSTNPAATLLEDCTFQGTDQGQAVVGHTNNGRGYTMRRCELTGAGDGAKASHGVHIFDCYIHDQYDSGAPHVDGIQNSGGGTNVIVSGCTIISPYHTSTSCLMFQTRCGDITDVTIDGNFFFGGSYSVYTNQVVQSKCGNEGVIGNISNVVVRNNYFCDESTGASWKNKEIPPRQVSGWQYMISSSGQAQYSNNVLLSRAQWQG